MDRALRRENSAKIVRGALLKKLIRKRAYRSVNRRDEMVEELTAAVMNEPTTIVEPTVKREAQSSLALDVAESAPSLDEAIELEAESPPYVEPFAAVEEEAEREAPAEETAAPLEEALELEEESAPYVESFAAVEEEAVKSFTESPAVEKRGEREFFAEVSATERKTIELFVKEPKLDAPVELFAARSAAPLGRQLELPASASVISRFDRYFNEGCREAAELFARRKKIEEGEWLKGPFLYALFYEYSYPHAKRGNKRAKKIGSKAGGLATRQLAKEELPFAEKHRELCRAFFTKLCNESYEAAFHRLLEKEERENRGEIECAAYHSDCRLYFSEEVREHYYALEREAIQWGRDHFGSASDHEFTLDIEKFDQKIDIEKKNSFIASLFCSDLAAEEKKRGVAHYARPGKLPLPPYLQKAIESHKMAAANEVMGNYFGENFIDIDLSIMREHLYYYERYIECAKGYHPPLTDEEFDTLKGRLKEGECVTDALRPVDDFCGGEALRALIAKEPNLTWSWRPKRRAMRRAFRLVALFDEMLVEEGVDATLVGDAVKALVDRRYEEKLPKGGVVKGYLEEPLERAWWRLESRSGERVDPLRTVNDTIAFVEELFRLHPKISGSALLPLLQEPGEEAKLLSIVTNRVQEERGLSSHWQPDRAIASAACDIDAYGVEMLRKRGEFLAELLSVARELERDDLAEQLTLALVYAKEALYSSVAALLYPENGSFTSAFAMERRAAAKCVEAMEKRGRAKAPFPPSTLQLPLSDWLFPEICLEVEGVSLKKLEASIAEWLPISFASDLTHHVAKVIYQAIESYRLAKDWRALLRLVDGNIAAYPANGWKIALATLLARLYAIAAAMLYRSSELYACGGELLIGEKEATAGSMQGIVGEVIEKAPLSKELPPDKEWGGGEELLSVKRDLQELFLGWKEWLTSEEIADGIEVTLLQFLRAELDNEEVAGESVEEALLRHAIKSLHPLLIFND